MPGNVNVLAEAIKKGLDELLALLNEPITEHVLDLAHNVKNEREHKVLIRTHRSLTQYMELEGDLFYVGLLGHFSSGKSSTINSVLELWKTADERETDLNPTDDTITLITRSKNEKLLLGVIREGTVTIRFKPIDNPLLDNIVLVDTPGTGDPQLVKEIARDFLPICDVILFCFSAASPLDTNDMPLLEELHKHLPFVPIYFVITRADELRQDIHAPLTEENIDQKKRRKFFDEVLMRMNNLLKPEKNYTDEQFMLIDNKHGYNIDALAGFIRAKCDPANGRSRVTMHAQKLGYFTSMAKHLRNFFESVLDKKLKELTKIVQTAEQNRVRYTEKVRISNNNLTKTWVDQLAAVQLAGEKAQGALAGAEQIPASIEAFEAARKRREEINAEIAEDALRTARHVNETLKIKIGTRVTEQIRKFELGNLERAAAIDPGKPADGISFAAPAITLNKTTTLVPSYLTARWASLREAKAAALRDAASTLRKSVDELNTMTQTASPLSDCEKIVQVGKDSLSEDLSRFFVNAELYRAGVFTHTTKASIGALGLGKELDDLESEFNEAEIAPYTAGAMERLFPDFDRSVAEARATLTAIDKRARTLSEKMNDLRIPSPDGNQNQLGATLEAESSSLTQQMLSDLRDNMGIYLSKLEAKLSAIVADKRHAYEEELNGARQIRYMIYGGAIAGGVVLGLLSYLSYSYAFDIPPTNFHAVLWNLVAQAVWVAVAFVCAKAVDNFPRRSATIRYFHQVKIREELERRADDELETHDFPAINVAGLVNRLTRIYHTAIDADPDEWNRISADRLNALRELQSEFISIRSEYAAMIDTLVDKASSYFSDVPGNLETLNEISDKIKVSAIEPSFKLLADTHDRLESIKKKVHEIEFG